MNFLHDFIRPSLFETLLAQSAKASALVVVATLLCLLPKRWLSPGWRHLLWCVVFARLLLPDVPITGWSWNINNLLSDSPRLVAVDTGTPAPDSTVNGPDILPKSVDSEISRRASPAPANVDRAGFTHTPPATPVAVKTPATMRFSWQSIAGIVWCAGTLAWWTALAGMWWRFRRRVLTESSEAGSQAQAVLRACLDETRIRTQVPLRYLEHSSTPAVCGLIRPVILIPRALEASLPASEFRLVLLHEIGHVKRRDLWVLVAASLLLGLHWWNPMLWYAWQRLRHESESATDAWVLQRTGPETATSYGAMLLNLAARASLGLTALLLMPWVLNITCPGERLRQRIMAIASYRPLRCWTALAGMATLAILTMTGFSQERHAAPRKPDATSPANDSKPAPEQAGDKQSRAFYDQVKSAVVSIRVIVDGNTSSGTTGVLVSADGLILARCLSPHGELTVQLSDGRRMSASRLGFSKEWDVSLARLNEPGPWPHAVLADSAGVKPDQRLFLLASCIHEMDIPLPFFGAAMVKTSVSGRWFATGHALPLLNTDFSIAFDPNGHVVGVESTRYLDPARGCQYTAVEMIRSLWDDLAAGKNLDQIRMMGLVKNPAHQASTAGAAPKSISKEAQHRVSAASVYIRQGAEGGCSGTIISADGVIATCAHHLLTPGTKISVSLPDGRDVAGEVLGSSMPADVGLMRIVDAGSFPFVEMGDSSAPAPGDPCYVAGYGPVDDNARQPSVRTASITESPDGRWSHEVYTNMTLVGGDSGGGLFDISGRLIGIHCSSSPTSAHARVELFRKHWDALRNPSIPVTASAPKPGSATAEAIQATARQRDSVVEVRDGGRLVALGTIVTADGKIVTKASVLRSAPVCRLNDGREFPATVLKRVRENDVAVLKIQATGLPVIGDSPKTNLSVGTRVAVMTDRIQPMDSGSQKKATADVQPVLGLISNPSRSSPPERGFLRTGVEDSEQGLRIPDSLDTSADWEQVLGPQVLQKGDILLSIEGHSVANLAALSALLLDKKREPIALTGDPVHLAISREGKKMDVQLTLAPHYWSGAHGQSARCSGFKDIFHVTAHSNAPYDARPWTSLCGGPVCDPQGGLLGVAIAWRTTGSLLVLPVEVIKSMALE